MWPHASVVDGLSSYGDELPMMGTTEKTSTKLEMLTDLSDHGTLIYN
jgi:hypothetical protein